MQINKCVLFGVLHWTALHACYPFPNLPCLQRANWWYATFLKLCIQNGQKLISLAWISLQLLYVLLICLEEVNSWKYPIWCQESPSFATQTFVLVWHWSANPTSAALGSVLRWVRFFWYLISRISRKIEVISSLA